MDKDSVWMFGPIISKLPSQVQGRVLKLAAQNLEAGTNVINKGKFDKERNLKRLVKFKKGNVYCNKPPKQIQKQHKYRDGLCMFNISFNNISVKMWHEF